jgi:VIT1/CCC1 family predicted Fe2+/Mn2+ transporter
MTDAERWAFIVGFFLPVAIAVIQQAGWSERVRAVVAFLACVVAGLGTAYFGGDLSGSVDPRSVISDVLIVLVTAISTYKAFWKPTGVAPAVEEATSRPFRA